MKDKELAELKHKASLYKQVVHIYPDEPRYLRRYAEVLLQLGKKVQADNILLRLHTLLTQSGHDDEAEDVARIRKEIAEGTHAQEPLSEQLSPFLHFADNKLMDLLLTNISRRHVNEGEFLLRQGGTGDDMYVILEGELAVLTHLDDRKKPILVYVLSEGDIVGEMAFLHDSARSADVLANKDTTLLELSRKHVVKCLLQFPELETAMSREAETRHRMLVISCCPVLADLPAELRRKLAEAAETRNHAPFEVICRAGSKPDTVGIVASGLIRIVAEDALGQSHILDPIKPGGLIGELVALRDEPMIADHVSVEQTSVVHIPLKIFHEMAEIHAPIREQLIKQAAQRIASTMVLISDHSRRGKAPAGE